MSIEIYIDGDSRLSPSGLVGGAQLYEIAHCHPHRLFLSREDGIDIPISEVDHLLITRHQRFVTGVSDIEDNPPLRTELRPEFNGSRDLELPRAKITAEELTAQDAKFPNGRLFADIPDGPDIEIDDAVRLIVQDTDSYFVIPPGDVGSPIDLETCGKHGRRPPRGGTYRYRLDRDPYVSETATISGEEILARAGKNLAEWSLNQKLRGGKRIRVDGAVVDLATPGIERFESVRRQAQQGT